MASGKRAWGICDQCGFRYRHRELKKNSYGMLVCPSDYDGRYDLKNHPQNRSPNVRDDEYIKNPRAPSNSERNLNWEEVETLFEKTDKYWNTI